MITATGVPRMTNKMITTQKAAEITGYTEHNIRKLARGGRIEATRFGRMWMIARDSIIAYREHMTTLGPAKHTPRRYREETIKEDADADT